MDDAPRNDSTETGAHNQRDRSNLKQQKNWSNPWSDRDISPLMPTHFDTLEISKQLWRPLSYFWALMKIQTETSSGFQNI